jgi:curved DNA-binding protein CbpA
MARPLDPWRTLDLPRDATLDEVKAAYRRLAKRYHPDSAGEAALTRFLAVQAAYEALTEGPARLRLGLSGRTARAAARPPRPTGGPQRASGGATGSSSRTDAAGSRPGAGGRTGSGRMGESGSAGQSTSRRGASRKRAKPGSTSYDDAQFEPFEPSWEGASWYGESSGTYWTLNPREFADPRKHGPEYQARARSARAARGRGPADEGLDDGSRPHEEPSTWEREAAAGGRAPGMSPPGVAHDGDARDVPHEEWGPPRPGPAGGSTAAGWAGAGWTAAGRARRRADSRLGSTPLSTRLAAEGGWASPSAGDLVSLALFALGVATLVFVLLGSPAVIGLEPTVAIGGLSSIVVALIVRGLASRHSPG